MVNELSEDIWTNVAKNIIKAGPFKTPLNKAVIELSKTLLTADQAKFLLMFDSATLSIDQIKEQTSLKDNDLDSMLSSLMDTGIILGLPSRSTGIMVYRLMPLFPGIFELSFMKGQTGPKEKKLAQLYDQIFEDMIPEAQAKYERTVKSYQKMPAFDRILPVEEEISESVEKILPVEEVKRLIEKFDVIGVAKCYCRHEKELLNEPCKLKAPTNNCMNFGRFAQFLIDRGFAKRTTKEEAKKILKEAEKYGLVHKTFHDRLNPEMDEIAVCSCCKCCCGIFDLYYRGVIPLHSLTSYRSLVNKDKCAGCGTCVERCPTEAIELVDVIANVDENKCIGCGACTTGCPEEAIKLERTGPREIFIPYRKI